ncbi:hypothetical protein [Streptomyces sp. NPDC002328]|uniref:hypothetical protein n=1 Tax=Streptomyces sp. NPDC002328 TaxID=3364642 RepID=UPI00367544FE
MEGWNFWWGIAAFFLGVLATQLNSWLAYRRQRKDRADDAADALRARREEFELQHLVEVNELMQAAVAALLDYHVSVLLFVDRRDRNSLSSEVEERREAAGAAAQELCPTSLRNWDLFWMTV